METEPEIEIEIEWETRASEEAIVLIDFYVERQTERYRDITAHIAAIRDL